VDSRITHSHRRRAEERVVCAILHASSPLGFLALAASGTVWATQRSRSRFLALQSLQALMFQLLAFLGSFITYWPLALAIGIAVFSDWIAPTDAAEPALTTAMLIIGVLGFAIAVFFQAVFPWWGMWAAFRILRGHNFRYPVLGRIVVGWSARQPVNAEAASTNAQTAPETSNGETVLAGVAHLSTLVGLSPILAPVLWATAKHRSRFLAYNLLQAALFQLLMMGASYVCFLSSWVLIALLVLFSSVPLPAIQMHVMRFVRPNTMFFGWMGVIGILMLATVISVLIAAIRAFQGKASGYPIVGSWLTKYLADQGGRDQKERREL
jgi:uncharacterized Tic20 family protein